MGKHSRRAVFPEGSEHEQVVSRGEWTRSAHATGYRPQTSAGRDNRRRRCGNGRVILIVVLILVALVCTEAFFLYSSYSRVKAYGSDVTSSVSSLKGALKSDDTEALRTAASNINIDAHGIQNELNSPAWEVAKAMPVIGQDVRSAATLGDVLVDLSDNALSPLATNSEDLNLSNLMSDGAINVEALQNLSGIVEQAQPVVSRSAEAVDALPTETRIAKVGELVGKARTSLDKAASALDKANAILPYLPSMLGANGETKNYLIVAQNNSELRSTGGFPGSWTNMSITDGRIVMGDSATLQHADQQGDLGWTQEERDTFWLMQPNDPSGVSIIPDFSVAGSRMAEAYARNTGTVPDGTIAIDPVFLQALLKLTGGVVTSDGTQVDGSNAAQALLSDVYWRYGNNGDAQDAFFAEVAALTFNKLMSSLGSVKVTDLQKTLEEGIESRRFQVWMRDDSHEAVFDGLGATGKLSQDTQHPTLGVFLTDNTWAKMDWYLRMGTTVGDPVANGDGTYTRSVTTTLTNTSTADGLATAPKYVTGTCPLKRDITDIVLFPILVAPAGGTISNITISNGFKLDEHSCYGLDIWSGYVNVNASEGTVTLTYDVTTSADAGENELSVMQTPLAQTEMDA